MAPRSQKTSLNLKYVAPAQYGSYALHHQAQHRSTLDYIHHDRTALNESWHKELTKSGTPKTLKGYLNAMKTNVKEKTGRSMQKKSEEKALGSAVVVVDEHTTMDDLKALGESLEKAFGWTCIQIHLHKDEGHLKSKGKMNLHAHILFELINRETGKTWKKSHEDWSRMQDITAQSLNLTRGERVEKTGKKHLSEIEYKVQQEEAKYKKLWDDTEVINRVGHHLKKELEKTKGELEETKKELKQLEEQKTKASTELLLSSEERIKQGEQIWMQEKSGFFSRGTDYEKAYTELRKFTLDEIAKEREKNRIVQQEIDDLKAQKRAISNDHKREVSELKKEHENAIQSIFEELGDMFKRFWEELQLLKNVKFLFRHALFMWQGGAYNVSETRYSADKTNGAVLKDGKRVCLIEAQEQEKKIQEEMRKAQINQRYKGRRL